MGLETSVYIDGLVPSNPTGSDLKSLGDDHLRLIKSTIKNTFPNIKGAVNLTHEALNLLGNVELFIKTGMIIMWTGTVETIPAGWKLCNGAGSISNGQLVPNLVDRFPVGAGAKYAAMAVGGTLTHIPTGTVTVAGHILTAAQLPPHTHSQKYRGAQSLVASGQADGSLDSNAGYYEKAGVQTGSTGAGEAHTHAGSTFAGTAVDHTPPYCGVYFIIKN